MVDHDERGKKHRGNHIKALVQLGSMVHTTMRTWLRSVLPLRHTRHILASGSLRHDVIEKSLFQSLIVPERQNRSKTNFCTSRSRCNMDAPSRSLEIPVLIVGAGPVGMYLSILLSRYGISSIVVDRGERGGDHGLGTRPHPRAHVLNTRTMELLREIGLDRYHQMCPTVAHIFRSREMEDAIRQIKAVLF